MNRPPYMDEPWFAMLSAAIKASNQSAVARALACTPSLISQVVHGTGHYGTGAASTRAIAARVLDTFGNWPCPFLGDGGDDRVITAAQCRGYAHRDAPTSSPRDLAHWRACRSCPNAERSKPPVPRPAIHRPRHSAQAEIFTASNEGDPA